MSLRISRLILIVQVTNCSVKHASSCKKESKGWPLFPQASLSQTDRELKACPFLLCNYTLGFFPFSGSPQGASSHQTTLSYKSMSVRQAGAEAALRNPYI
jgi:hypothetical protein